MGMWDRIVAADPRIGRLVDAAVGITGSTWRHEHTADSVYVDAKAYLKALAGWKRGQRPTARNTPPMGHDWLFAQIVAEPVDVSPDDDEFLRGSSTFDATCSELYNRICEAYDRKRAA